MRRKKMKEGGMLSRTRCGNRPHRAASIALVTLSVLVSASVAASAVGHRSVTTIRVGEHWCLTGPAAYAGAPLQRGTEFAAAQINRTHYLGSGIQVKLVAEDDGSSPVTGVTAAQRLIQVDHVSAIVGGCTSAATLASVKVAQDAHIPWVVANAFGPGIVETGNYIFRTSQPYTPFVGELVRKVVPALHVKTAALIYAADNPSLSVTASDYTTFLKRKGVSIVDSEGIPNSTTNFSTVLTKIKSLKPQPDVLAVIMLGPQAANIMLQARNDGIQSVFLGHQGTNTPDLYTIAGSAAVGTIMPSNWFTTINNTLNKQFVKQFSAKFHQKPDAFAANGYAGMMVLARALKKAQSSNPAKIQAALAKLYKIPTIYGPMTFDNREGYAPGVIVQIGPGGAFRLWQPPK
jgi:branched-chain amino acid transport system substrate-binding protein